jgi:ATP-dependent DNA helicase RecG
MKQSEHQLIEMIKKGESIDLEFKTCRNQLNRDIYETVCAFLNRHGGTLLLGVKDDGTIEGIAPDAIEQIRRDFITAINNPQKLIPPTYLSINELNLKGKSYYEYMCLKAPRCTAAMAESMTETKRVIWI